MREHEHIANYDGPRNLRCSATSFCKPGRPEQPPGHLFFAGKAGVWYQALMMLSYRNVDAWIRGNAPRYTSPGQVAKRRRPGSYYPFPSRAESPRHILNQTSSPGSPSTAVPIHTQPEPDALQLRLLYYYPFPNYYPASTRTLYPRGEAAPPFIIRNS